MTAQYKADFDKLEWESPIEGVRHKYIDQNNLRIRLVEYRAGLAKLDMCISEGIAL